MCLFAYIKTRSSHFEICVCFFFIRLDYVNSKLIKNVQFQFHIFNEKKETLLIFFDKHLFQLNSDVKKIYLIKIYCSSIYIIINLQITYIPNVPNKL